MQCNNIFFFNNLKKEGSFGNHSCVKNFCTMAPERQCDKLLQVQETSVGFFEVTSGILCA